MKKRLTFITFLMLFCSTIFGQSHWEMTQGEIDSYQDAQTLCLSVQINNVDIEEEGLEIAAFHNNTLRGVATTKYFKPKNTYYANIKVYGTTPDETISFRLYDTTGEEAKELSSDYTIDWNPNNTLGSPATPISVNFYEKHWEDNSGSFRFSMTIVCTIEIDNVIQHRSDLELAAFYGEELRGSTKVERMGETDFYVASLPVGGNTNNEIISFKLYDPTIDLELNTDYTVPFIADSQIGEEEPLTMRFFTPIAMINDQYFTSLAAAVEAAKEGNNEITLLKNVEGSGLVINKDVIIDFADFYYKFTSPAAGTAVGLKILKGEGTANDVTIKNGNFIVSEKANLNILVENYADLTIENVILNGQNLTDNSYVLSFVSGEVDINNSKIFANSVAGETHYAFRTMNQDGFSAPVVNLWYDLEHYLKTFNEATGIGEVLYTNTVTGLVEYTGGSILGNTGNTDNTNKILDVVAKKSFKAAPGTGVAGWGTISTPVYTEGQTCILIPAAEEGAHDLYKYDEKTAGWLYYTGENAQHPFNTFDLGQGYLYANTEATTIELQGKLANGQAVGFNISYNPTLPNGEVNPLAGFNFIGNPYACNIALGQFNLEGSGFTMSTGFYHITEEGALEVVYVPKNDYIKPMESVMIKVVPESSKSVNHRSMLTILPYSVAERSIENNGYLTINVSNNDYSDVAYVSFNEGLGLDKINHRNSDIPMVSVSVDGVDYALATMSQDVTEIPVTFKAAQMGEYTIGVEARDCEYSTMTLVDRLSGIETNLLLEDYTFIAKSGDNSDRFVIRLAKDNGSNNGSENFAYINNGMMFINNIAGQAVINVYDVTGRPIAEYNVAESASISTSDFAAGMYIIRMSDENGVKVQKIIVE